MGLSTSYSKAESDIKDQKLKQLFSSGLHDKPLKIADPVPTVAGGYILKDVGDYSFGNAPDGKWNVAFLSSGTWEIVSIALSGGNSESNSGELVNFSENIYFDKQAVSIATVTAPIIFKPFGTNAKIMGSTLVRLISDGINIPDFSKFKKLNGSQDYDNTNGVLNTIFFFYDGFDAWVNIWQGIGTSDIDFSDATPPTAPTIQITDTQDKSVSLAWSGATDNVAVTSYEIYVNGILKNTVSASPYTVTNLNPSTLYELKVKAKDAAGNTSVFSNALSTTTLAPQNTPIIFNSLSSGATFTNNTLQGNSGSGGIVVSLPQNWTRDNPKIINKKQLILRYENEQIYRQPNIGNFERV